MEVEQISLVGEYSDTTNQTELFETSRVDYIELSNLVSMNFTQSINKTYLTQAKQNFTISLNSLSN